MPGPDPNDLGNDTAAGVLVILIAYLVLIAVIHAGFGSVPVTVPATAQG